MKDVRQKLMALYGIAASFRMLDTQTDDPSGELQAAKDTGLQLEAAISELFKLCGTYQNEFEQTIVAMQESNQACDAASHRLGELSVELQSVRPKADAYNRVCEALGIEGNILGYIANLKRS